MHPENSPDNSSARVRQAAKQRVETAYAHAPLMLAHDRRVLDVPLEERLQSRTSELLAWAKTMLPVINRSVRDARTITNWSSRHPQLLLKATVVTTGDTAATPPVPSTVVNNTTSTEPRSRRATSWIGGAFRARTRIATLSYDIRQYFPGIADSAT
jgi:hypothetical protein